MTNGGDEVRTARRGWLNAAALAAVAGVLWLGAAEPASQAAPARRVVLLSIDAGADWIADRLVAEGKAPAFQAMAREGAVAEAMVTVMPSLTAVSHASLWTGTLPRHTGVTGNTLPGTPPAEHSLLDTQSGYLSDPLVAEPIWITASRAGKRVFIVQATGGYPFRDGAGDRLTQFDAYANNLLRAELVRGRLQDGRSALRVGDDEVTVSAEGAGTLRLHAGGSSSRISATHAYSTPLPARVKGEAGAFRVGLVALDDGSGEFALWRGGVFSVRASRPDLLASFVADAGVLIGESAGFPYERGAFGTPLFLGGDGAAERHLVAAAAANQEYFEGGLRHASRHSWDLLVLYVPNMDMIGHALVGMLDPASPIYSDDVAVRIWPVYEEAFRRCADAYVAQIRTLFPDATLVVGADHGMEGNGPQFYPNVALREAGLLATTPDGGIDLARSRAVFLYSHGGGVYVNATRWKDGIVPPGEHRAVRDAATAALLGARDATTGAPLVRAIFDPEVDGEALGIGGAYAPDLYVDPALGYQIRPGADEASVSAPGPRNGSGAHGPAPWRRKLHAFFYAAGPGVTPGTRLGQVRTIDVAPTVSRLLGIPLPANAIGRPLPIGTEP